MGLWASYLAFRTPADGHEPLPDRERDTSAAVAGWTYLTERVEAHGELEAAVVDLPGPVLLSVVCDSDFADVRGYLNGERQWTAFINQPTATVLEAPTPDLQPDEDEDLLNRITAWAQAADAPPVDRDQLRAVFAPRYIFADDGLLALEQLLGVISPDVRPFGDGAHLTHYRITVWPPTGERVPDATIAAVAHAVQGEVEPPEPVDPDGYAHPDDLAAFVKRKDRVAFRVPLTHDAAVAVPACAAALRRLGTSPTTRLWWDGSMDWTTLAELNTPPACPAAPQ